MSTKKAKNALAKAEQVQKLSAEPMPEVPEVTDILLKCYQVIGAEMEAYRQRKVVEGKIIDIRHFKALMDSLKIAYELEELEIERMRKLGVLDRYVDERYKLPEGT